MAEKRVRRRLAAILAADVVGYSRLMQADETGTLAALKALRTDLLDPKVAEYGGRVVKLMGDGVLVEFPSAVDAVSHAVDVQDAMARRNAGVPEDRRLELRIGINVGDVIVDGEDLYGDGVNVAARLEALAEPGGTCVSGTVFDQVKDKLPLGFADLGPQAVKNIAEPVRTYRLRSGAEAPGASAPAPAEGPSIAVLAFENMSGDPEQAYFSDGIAEDIITEISKLSGLLVIARNSSFAYRGRSVDVKRIARELGVGYVLEGSVRKAANRVRVTAQLIDGRTAAHLWAERYDRDLEDIFAIQDEITSRIVEALKVKLDVTERERIGARGTTNVEAYDYMLRGRDLVYRASDASCAEAVGLLEKAITLDPELTAAYEALALAMYMMYLSGWHGSTEETLERGHRLAVKAVELDPNGAEAHRVLALAHLWRYEWDRAIAEADKAVVLGTSNAEAHAARGYVLSYASRPAEAIESLERAMRLDPRHPNIWLHFLAHAYFIKGDYEAAAAQLNRRIRLMPETDMSRALLASCYGHLGREAEARDEWAKVLEVNPDFSIERRARVLPYRNPSDWERILEGLGKAGLP